MDIKSSTIREARYLARLEFLKRPPEMIYYYGKIPEYVGESAPSARFPKEGVGRPKTVADGVWGDLGLQDCERTS